MKQLLLVLFFTGLLFTSFANHTKGGWIYYKYVGPGTNVNTAVYSITLKLYTECTLNSNQYCADINISIFNAGDNSLYQTVNVSNNNDLVDIQNCTQQECHECISDIPNICYKIATYTFTKELPASGAGYIISYQRCCRIANIINLLPGSSAVGDTWTVTIPGLASLDPDAFKNSSALFSQNDTAIICKGNYFTFDFSATDSDRDSLAYSFTDAYYSGRGNGGQCNGVSDLPPFTYVGYQAPFSGRQPMGPDVTINPLTGIVSGIAPNIQGTYVITCTVTEYKKGTNIIRSTVHKSIHISVADCSLTQAILDPEYYSCNGFTKSFSNKSAGGNIQTYFWEFGVQGVINDTSNLANPSFTYPDTGSYVLKLVVNRNLPCSDSTLSVVKVYPVFNPGFTVQGQCKNTPIRFFDISTTTYGIVNYWKWNFGDDTSTTNSSLLQSPTHIYATSANYVVSFTVSNNRGCKDTLSKTILIADKPALELTNDTLICNTDTIQLKAIGFGTVLWRPNYNLNDSTSFSPLVSPVSPTKYFATLTDPYGCVGTDSVFVNVKNFVTILGGKDTTICQTDTFFLPLTGDALYYSWTENPVGSSLNNPSLKNPLAKPLVTTRYQVTGSIGKCYAQDDILVSVVPYPKAQVGADTAICLGTSAQLHATGGSQYFWSPAAFLNNRLIANPIAQNPPTDIRYTVAVKDTLGCPKTVTASLQVFVQKVNAVAGSRDTAVVLDQPLQLNAAGGVRYLWNPAQWLDNSAIANPVALPRNDIEYTVKVSNAAGCSDYASVRVKVFRVAPGIYVPTAFSPNGDGLNDFFKVRALGLKSLEVFRVFNRFGQLLFTDTKFESAGWDGTFKGNSQDPATYIWYAEGTDYRGQKIQKKGYVVLVR
jgi:gliding motility-associated-like protein